MTFAGEAEEERARNSGIGFYSRKSVLSAENLRVGFFGRRGVSIFAMLRPDKNTGPAIIGALERELLHRAHLNRVDGFFAREGVGDDDHPVAGLHPTAAQ